MSIVSSVISKDRDDGFMRMIEEKHTDSTGGVHVIRRYLPHGADATTLLAVHAEQIAADLAAAEAEELLQ